MRNQSISAADSQFTHDITEIVSLRIDKSRPVASRITDYLKQVKDPAHFLCGGTPVELRFAPSGAPGLDALIAGYFISKKAD